MHDAHAQVPFVFQPGQPARAAEVNANFDAVAAAVNESKVRIDLNEEGITALSDTITALLSAVNVLESSVNNLQNELAAATTIINTLEGQVAAINNSNVMALDPYVTVTMAGAPRVRFSGVNLQVVNGRGTTGSVNGLGNFIVGYDQPRVEGTPICSDGRFQDMSSCIANGEIWAINHKSGSHNIVGGDMNSYSSFGGFVVGIENAINSEYASVSGGAANIATGFGSSVVGGRDNVASEFVATVSGGIANIASGNTASVSGGRGNVASGNYSSVSGGNSRTAPGENNWAAGSRFEEQ
jgi:hypothetical protein